MSQMNGVLPQMKRKLSHIKFSRVGSLPHADF